jgi:hypothetical protein
MTTKEKIAVPLDFAPSIVVLNDGERMMRKEAKAKGWKIHGEPDEVATPKAGEESLRAHKIWRSTILGMPEARDRESAAVEIVTTQNRETMSIESARAFLRGLPTEQTEAPNTTMTTSTDPRAARMAELSNSMAAYNKNNGYQAKPKAVAPSLADVEPTKLRRLAEIRLNALQSGATPVSASEQKLLKYALEVQDIRLANTFATLGVNTSKILPRA